MEDFPEILKQFLISQMQNGGWTETNPLWNKVKWAYDVSRQFLTDDGRRNSNWLWILLRNIDTQAETERVTTSWQTVDVYIFACAASSNIKHVQDAEKRMFNMAKIIGHLINTNKTSFAPAWIGRTDGGRPLPPIEAPLKRFVMVLPVKFQYDEQ